MEGFGDIPIFVAVVEHGGFSSAARALGVSKSAISRRIVTLEKRLGVRLLSRTTRRLRLTEAGERYYRYAARAVAAMQDAEDELGRLQGEPRGRLRVSAPMSFGRLHLASMVPLFLKKYPQIHLEMVMDDRVINLVEDGIDIAIRGGSLADSSLIARKLAPFRSMICASPGYLAQHGTPQHPSDLAKHNCLLFTYSAESDRWTFRDDAGTQTIEAVGNYKVNNSEALREAALQGLGVVRLPSFVALEEVRAGRLIWLLSHYQMPEKAFYAVYLKRDYLPVKVQIFLDYLTQHLAGPTWEVQSS